MNRKEDRYVDILIECALAQEEDEEIDALIPDADEELPTVSDEHKERIWRLFKKKQKSKRHDTRRALHSLRIAADVAACFIILLAISVTVGMENNERFRSSIYRLLMSSYVDATEAKTKTEDKAAFYVPASWAGSYYPSTVPTGFHTVTPMDGDGTSMELWDQNQRMLILEENAPQTIAWVDTEGAEVSSTNINGRTSYIFEKSQSSHRYSCTVVMDLEDRYYVISALNVSRAELMEIAGSVQRVVME